MLVPFLVIFMDLWVFSISSFSTMLEGHCVFVCAVWLVLGADELGGR